jgi:phospholipid/cholesterol/gamma-HCH transport system substrate-binding protein
LSSTGDRVAKAAGELNAITEDVSRLLKAAQSPDAPLGVLLQDPEFADDLQRTMENMRLGTAELETTLEAAQKSFLMRKRILRRNKEDRGKKDKE